MAFCRVLNHLGNLLRVCLRHGTAPQGDAAGVGGTAKGDGRSRPCVRGGRTVVRGDVRPGRGKENEAMVDTVGKASEADYPWPPAEPESGVLSVHSLKVFIGLGVVVVAGCEL